MENISISQLKEMKTWMLWKRKKREGKISKVPFSCQGKYSGTSEKYKDSWVPYDEAIQAVKVQNADGVGFKIPKEMFFLDIDHLDLNDPMVEELIKRFDSYTEYSVSGAGIHIYGLCDCAALEEVMEDKDGKRSLSKEYYIHHPDNGLELYIGELTNRFSVFTGNVISDKPLRDCTEEIRYVLNQYMKKPTKVKASASNPVKSNPSNTNLDKQAEAVIRRLKKQQNYYKFRRLFEEGCPEDGRSQSVYDIVLCAIIAFQTGDNPELIDAVFRKSALYRDKWEREDYRNQTISKAIEAYGRKKAQQKEVPSFVKTDENGRQSVSAPLLAKYVRENLDYIQVRDRGNQTALRYVYEDGVYKLYDQQMLYGVIKKIFRIMMKNW